MGAKPIPPHMSTIAKSLQRVLSGGESKIAIQIEDIEEPELLKEVLSEPFYSKKGDEAIANCLDTNKAARCIWEYYVSLFNGIGSVVLEETVDSTMDNAKRYLRDWASHKWVLVVAKTQLKGRGRYHRRWVSPPGGLWLTLGTRLGREQPDPVLTLIVGAYIAYALELLVAVPIQLKWPNDIVLEGYKLGGILVETTIEPHGENSVFIGVGINVNNKRDELPEGAIALREVLGKSLKLPVVLCHVAWGIGRALKDVVEENKERAFRIWVRRDACNNKKIKIATHEGVLEGVEKGITREGMLRILTDSGEIEVDGDVLWCEGIKYKLQSMSDTRG